jgi:hypothetical protein
MIALAWVCAVLAAALAAMLRTGAASMVTTPRADALHDAADGRRGADRVARLLEQPR